MGMNSSPKSLPEGTGFSWKEKGTLKTFLINFENLTPSLKGQASLPKKRGAGGELTWRFN